jgi:hypothetical protein
MSMIKTRNLVKAMAIVAASVSICLPSISQAATDSSTLQSQVASSASYTPQKYQSYVNTNDCIKLTSSPYVIVLGNGGANMNLTCPASRPVMYRWQQQVGFGGILSVSSGGGSSNITCCAVAQKWSA